MLKSGVLCKHKLWHLTMLCSLALSVWLFPAMSYGGSWFSVISNILAKDAASDYQLVMLMRGDSGGYVTPLSHNMGRGESFSPSTDFGMHARLNVCLRSAVEGSDFIEDFKNNCVPAFVDRDKPLQFVGGYLATPSHKPSLGAYGKSGSGDDRWPHSLKMCPAVCVLTPYTDCASGCRSPHEPGGAGQVFVMPSQGTVSLWPFMRRHLGDPRYSTLTERGTFVVGKALRYGVRVSSLVFVHRGVDVDHRRAEMCAKSLQRKAGSGGGKVVLNADLWDFIESIAGVCSDYLIDILTVSSDHSELGDLSDLGANVRVLSRLSQEILTPLSQRFGLSSSELSGTGDGLKKYQKCLPTGDHNHYGSYANCVDLDENWSFFASENIKYWQHNWYRLRDGTSD
ncbi:MAG: hypothetical protein OXC44_01560 [Proteobacteria bacterium]|nr:hypothetical protein [Pseudomonadota bacterium]